MITDYTKQVELIDVSKFDVPINIIGCGATGSFVAFILIKMGFMNINIYDFDDIEEHNIPNQLFMESQIGKPKVEAFYEIYKTFHNDEGLERITVHNEKITATNAYKLNGIIFCCVDSMNARKYIYQSAFKKGKADLWIESRLSIYGAYIYTLAAKDAKLLEKYETTLYDDAEAEVSVCGVSQTALPAAINAASMMVMQMISWFEEKELLNQIMYSIPELITINEVWKI